MGPDEQIFWMSKLTAFLHDPPGKALDIGGHEGQAASLMREAGLTDEAQLNTLHERIKPADWFSSSAERFVFPQKKCSTKFNGKKPANDDDTVNACFIHPVSSTGYNVDGNILEHTQAINEIVSSAIGGVDTDDPQTRFFLYWRRWLENAVSSDAQYAKDLAFLPADTRIPDHSIWNHMTVTSAVAGCIDSNGEIKPALLLFQLGPVQDFIAQARSTRDLWSGSYLLSWLMAHAMKAVSDAVGPDSIIFPNLRGNGIFDALHRETVYSHTFKSGTGKADQTCWERMLAEKRAKGDDLGDARWLLTPTLPNRFLALVPEGKAEVLAKAAEKAIHDELARIGAAVWQWVETEAQQAKGCKYSAAWKTRFDYQVKAFPQTSWAIQPWMERDACLAAYANLPVNRKREDGTPTPYDNLKDMLDLAEHGLPQAERDARYYSDKETKTRLNNTGLLWSAHYALVDAALAARRNTRDFAAWTDANAAGATKDSLSGKEESIGDEEFWNHLAENRKTLFKAASHRYGAMNLIKRLWCREGVIPYLPSKLGLKDQRFAQVMRFDAVDKISDSNRYGSPYVAVLAMDGDEMGKWVSGEKTPAFLDQLSNNAKRHLKAILDQQHKPGIKRLLTPSYHLQFSETLAHFSTWLAEPIVQAYHGQLIYAGGDDVLAMLPSDRAIECAKTLRAIFRGEKPEKDARDLRMNVEQSGFVSAGAGYPLMVPGPKADVSVGIAIGHNKAPLQMLVREAQNAEKLAKRRYDRGALAVSVYKHSGEIIHWGCKWNSAGLQLMEFMHQHANREQGEMGEAPISGRFPYALAALLQPYALQGASPDMHDVILTEFKHVVGQQGAGLKSKKAPDEEKSEREVLVDLGQQWLTETSKHLEDFIKLFLVETFINRHKGE